MIVLALLAFTAYALSRPTDTVIGNDPITPLVGSTEVRVQFPGPGNVTLFGFLSLPGKRFQPAPAVLIIPDFGSVDRDGITHAGSTPDRLYADIAQSLTARGFASVRYDPRGQGQSVLPSGSAIQLADLVGDGGAGLRFLAGRKEIDAKRLSVAGDGWGGLVALQVAAHDQSVTGVVLVSTPGRPVVDTIADQLLAAAPTPADGQRQVQQLRTTVASLLGGAHLPGPAELDPALRPILPQGQEGYLRALFGQAPPELARQIHIPTLIVRGSQDPAITAADADALAGAVVPRAEVLIAPGAGHTLNIETSGSVATPTTAPAPNSGVQSILGGTAVTVTRDTATLNAITNWITPPTGPPIPRVMVPQPGGVVGH